MPRRLRSAVTVRACAVAALCLLAAPAVASTVTWIEIEGAIGPATASYIERAVTESADRQAEALIIRLDTPGGLLDSTQDIVRTLLGSPVPTVVWVGPQGATATSAGCFITLAADVAAMAPATTIGAAHPVQMGEGATQTTEMKQKIENFAVSYIESIAARRQRNVEWARSAVRDSASIPADKALELHVIEVIAEDRADLLARLDGREIHGKPLKTKGATVVPIERSLREKVFQLLWRPEVMFVLMLIAIYGIMGELSNPGAIFPGVAGAIALVLLLYMAAILPINTAGLALVVLAIVLFVADAFTPTHGVLTAGGILAFAIGSLMLFDQPGPLGKLSLKLVIPATLVTAAFFLFVVGAGLRAQSKPARMGRETMAGQLVQAITPVDASGGQVLFEGELWRATSPRPLEPGQQGRVVRVAGLQLEIEPADETMQPPTPPESSSQQPT